MNSKAIRKQLFAAVAMVLVAAVALGSSTYAWFASNKLVTAETMSISAVSDMPALVISESESGTYSEIAHFTSTAADLKLTIPTNLTGENAATTADGIKWGYATSTSAAEVQARNPTTDVTAQKTEHVLEKVVYIKMADNTTAVGSNLKLNTVTITKGTNSISDAVRILAVVDGIKYNLYDPVTGVKGSAALAATVNNTPIPVHIYMYFDGTDDLAYTNQATDLTSVSAVMTFIIDEGTVPTIDLTKNVTLATTGTKIGDVTYYKITGATATGDKVIYSDSTPLSRTSKIYTADNDSNPTAMTKVEQTVILPN